jgi:hypothetical protein
MLKLRQEGNENLSWPPKRLPDDVREDYARAYGARFETKFFAPRGAKRH